MDSSLREKIEAIVEDAVLCSELYSSEYIAQIDRIMEVVEKYTEQVWAVVDMKYGVVGLYATKQLATKACKEGVGLDSGYAGSVEVMVVRKSVDAF
jgi:hypothetical protein